jgi:hypothetical protein
MSKKKSPAQLQREIDDALASGSSRPFAEPINKRKRVRHFSTTKDKRGNVHYYVTYEDLSGHEITQDELEHFRER